MILLRSSITLLVHFSLEKHSICAISERYSSVMRRKICIALADAVPVVSVWAGSDIDAWVCPRYPTGPGEVLTVKHSERVGNSNRLGVPLDFIWLVGLSWIFEFDLFIGRVYKNSCSV